MRDLSALGLAKSAASSFFGLSFMMSVMGHSLADNVYSDIPLPLTILAIDMSGSENNTDAARKLLQTFESKQADAVLNHAGPQIVALMPWAETSFLYQSTYYVVNNADEMRAIFLPYLKQLANGAANVGYQTHAENVYDDVQHLVSDVKNDGHYISGVQLVFVGDGLSYANNVLKQKAQVALRDFCTQTRVVISKMPYSGSLQWNSLYKLTALFDEARFDNKTGSSALCPDLQYPQYFKAVPYSRVEFPSDSGQTRFDADIFDAHVLRSFMPSGS